MNPDQIEARLARLHAPPPPPAFRARVLGEARAAWAEGTADRRAWARLRLGLAAAAVAGVVIAVLGTGVEESAMARTWSGARAETAVVAAAWADELGVEPRYAALLARVAALSARGRLPGLIGLSAWAETAWGGES